MKTPILPPRSHRHARYTAIALLAGSLGLASGFAQSSGSSGSDRSTSGSGSSGSTGGAWESDRASTDTRASVKRSDKKFIAKVAENTPKEIAIAQLAVERASSPQVKSYAQQIVSDHQQMSQQLVQLAQQKGITLENQAQLTASIPAPSTTHAASASPSTASGAGAAEDLKSDRHYRGLAKKSGAEFDKEFVAMMLDEHKKDVKLFQEQAKEAEDTAIRSFASQNATVLQGHLDRAQTLSQSVAE